MLSIDRFTIVQTTQPVSIRASYGPFSTKQTVPARFIVPDAIETQGDHQQVSTKQLVYTIVRNLMPFFFYFKAECQPGFIRTTTI